MVSDAAATRELDHAGILEEVAALLKLAKKTVHAMAQASEIPAFKVRAQRRLKRAELDQWIDAQPRGGDSGRGDADGR